MAIEIVKVYKEHYPAVRVIGKRYTDSDRLGGSFGAKWGEWFQNGWFAELERLPRAAGTENDCFGFMGCSDQGGSFEYWIGTMHPEGSEVPEGFQYVDIPEGDAGICWIHGRDDNGEIYGHEPHQLCMQKLQENGMGAFREDFKGPDTKWWWFFERYNDERFMNKDESGNVILDYGMYLS